MEQSIGVFGRDVLLWACLLRQTHQRPQPQALLQHANYLLDELKRAEETQQLPLQSVEDGMFAIAALIDEICMGNAELRPLWSQYSLQATRFNTNNAGVELFHRLQNVRQGPHSVIATYIVVLGLGFQGCYGLPGADRYALQQLRRETSSLYRKAIDPNADLQAKANIDLLVEIEIKLDEYIKEQQYICKAWLWSNCVQTRSTSSCWRRRRRT